MLEARPVHSAGGNPRPVRRSAAGDEVTVVRDEKKAREVALYRQVNSVKLNWRVSRNLKLENMFANMTEGYEVHEVNIAPKADVQAPCGRIRLLAETVYRRSESEDHRFWRSGITETDATGLRRRPTPFWWASTFVPGCLRVKCDTESESPICATTRHL